MMHITEDTPPDMLAGAMDLTVHLPNGRSVKMSVERCTPMMDVLMQITAAHHLQLSGYVIEALGMAPSSEYSDKILPYKPNTPIGTLDTQHIRVVQKARTLPVPKNIAPGHQPFESTFRLKVHLPRKQLFVSRVSMNVLLEDIMRKVCDEKNLDPSKYEFRHPDNQNEVLDPKLTLEHYKITEIYVVSKGSSRLSQAFSASDIMSLRKDEDRKHSKSSGGVFNLIFKRGKMSNGSGSLSSDNRSISPTHSDDSRSVTPPAIQQQIIKTSAEKPKVPQRKRRPAPKPPQPKEETKQIEVPADNPKKNENGLTICHSRNSSDSSGYHEASILSDNANTSLPRRPQTMIMSEDVGRNKLNGEHSKSTSNLTSMSMQSKSTSSLAFAGRKKKAPPPPPVLKATSSVTNLEKASPVVASPVEKRGKFKSQQFSHSGMHAAPSIKDLELTKYDSEVSQKPKFLNSTSTDDNQEKFHDTTNCNYSLGESTSFDSQKCYFSNYQDADDNYAEGGTYFNQQSVRDTSSCEYPEDDYWKFEGDFVDLPIDNSFQDIKASFKSHSIEVCLNEDDDNPNDDDIHQTIKEEHFSFKHKFSLRGSKSEKSNQKKGKNENDHPKILNKFHNNMTRKWSKKFENSLEIEKAAPFSNKRNQWSKRSSKKCEKEPFKFHKKLTDNPDYQASIKKSENRKFSFTKKAHSDTKPTGEDTNKNTEKKRFHFSKTHKSESLEIDSPTSSYKDFKDAQIHSPELSQFPITAKDHFKVSETPRESIKSEESAEASLFAKFKNLFTKKVEAGEQEIINKSNSLDRGVNRDIKITNVQAKEGRSKSLRRMKSFTDFFTRRTNEDISKSEDTFPNKDFPNTSVKDDDRSIKPSNRNLVGVFTDRSERRTKSEDFLGGSPEKRYVDIGGIEDEDCYTDLLARRKQVLDQLQQRSKSEDYIEEPSIIYKREGVEENATLNRKRSFTNFFDHKKQVSDEYGLAYKSDSVQYELSSSESKDGNSRKKYCKHLLTKNKDTEGQSSFDVLDTPADDRAEECESKLTFENQTGAIGRKKTLNVLFSRKNKDTESMFDSKSSDTENRKVENISGVESLKRKKSITHIFSRRNKSSQGGTEDVSEEFASIDSMELHETAIPYKSKSKEGKNETLERKKSYGDLCAKNKEISNSDDFSAPSAVPQSSNNLETQENTETTFVDKQANPKLQRKKSLTDLFTKKKHDNTKASSNNESCCTSNAVKNKAKTVESYPGDVKSKTDILKRKKSFTDLFGKKKSLDNPNVNSEALSEQIENLQTYETTKNSSTLRKLGRNNCSPGFFKKKKQISGEGMSKSVDHVDEYIQHTNSIEEHSPTSKPIKSITDQSVPESFGLEENQSGLHTDKMHNEQHGVFTTNYEDFHIGSESSTKEKISIQNTSASTKEIISAQNLKENQKSVKHFMKSKFSNRRTSQPEGALEAKNLKSDQSFMSSVPALSPHAEISSPKNANSEEFLKSDLDVTSAKSKRNRFQFKSSKSVSDANILSNVKLVSEHKDSMTTVNVGAGIKPKLKNENLRRSFLGKFKSESSSSVSKDNEAKAVGMSRFFVSTEYFCKDETEMCPKVGQENYNTRRSFRSESCKSVDFGTPKASSKSFMNRFRTVSSKSVSEIMPIEGGNPQIDVNNQKSNINEHSNFMKRFRRNSSKSVSESDQAKDKNKRKLSEDESDIPVISKEVLKAENRYSKRSFISRFKSKSVSESNKKENNDTDDRFGNNSEENKSKYVEEDVLKPSSKSEQVKTCLISEDCNKLQSELDIANIEIINESIRQTLGTKQPICRKGVTNKICGDKSMSVDIRQTQFAKNKNTQDLITTKPIIKDDSIEEHLEQPDKIFDDIEVITLSPTPSFSEVSVAKNTKSKKKKRSGIKMHNNESEMEEKSWKSKLYKNAKSNKKYEISGESKESKNAKPNISAIIYKSGLIATQDKFPAPNLANLPINNKEDLRQDQCVGSFPSKRLTQCSVEEVGLFGDESSANMFKKGLERYSEEKSKQYGPESGTSSEKNSKLIKSNKSGVGKESRFNRSFSFGKSNKEKLPKNIKLEPDHCDSKVRLKGNIERQKVASFKKTFSFERKQKKQTSDSNNRNRNNIQDDKLIKSKGMEILGNDLVFQKTSTENQFSFKDLVLNDNDVDDIQPVTCSQFRDNDSKIDVISSITNEIIDKSKHYSDMNINDLKTKHGILNCKISSSETIFDSKFTSYENLHDFSENPIVILGNEAKPIRSKAFQDLLKIYDNSETPSVEDHKTSSRKINICATQEDFSLTDDESDVRKSNKPNNNIGGEEEATGKSVCIERAHLESQSGPGAVQTLVNRINRAEYNSINLQNDNNNFLRQSSNIINANDVIQMQNHFLGFGQKPKVKLKNIGSSNSTAMINDGKFQNLERSHVAKNKIDSNNLNSDVDLNKSKSCKLNSPLHIFENGASECGLICNYKDHELNNSNNSITEVKGFDFKVATEVSFSTEINENNFQNIKDMINHNSWQKNINFDNGVEEDNEGSFKKIKNADTTFKNQYDKCKTKHSDSCKPVRYFSRTCDKRKSSLINYRTISPNGLLCFTQTTDEIFIKAPSDDESTSPEISSRKKLAKTRNFPNRKFTKNDNINWASSENFNSVDRILKCCNDHFDKARDKVCSTNRSSEQAESSKDGEHELKLNRPKFPSKLPPENSIWRITPVPAPRKFKSPEEANSAENHECLPKQAETEPVIEVNASNISSNETLFKSNESVGCGSEISEDDEPINSVGRKQNKSKISYEETPLNSFQTKESELSLNTFEDTNFSNENFAEEKFTGEENIGKGSAQMEISDSSSIKSNVKDVFKNSKEEIFNELKHFHHEKIELKKSLEIEKTPQNEQIAVLESIEIVDKHSKAINLKEIDNSNLYDEEGPKINVCGEEDIYEELKNFSHEKLQLKKSLEIEESSEPESLVVAETRNVNVASKESIYKPHTEEFQENFKMLESNDLNSDKNQASYVYSEETEQHNHSKVITREENIGTSDLNDVTSSEEKFTETNVSVVTKQTELLQKYANTSDEDKEIQYNRKKTPNTKDLDKTNDDRKPKFIIKSAQDYWNEKSRPASNRNNDEKHFGSSLKTKISLFENKPQTKLEDKSQTSYMQALDNIDIDLFSPKYRKKTMPLFPKSNDLEKPANAFDTFTRKRGFGIGRAMLDLETEDDSKADTVSQSSTISNDAYEDDEMSDVNVDMFAASEAPVKTHSANAMDELLGIHSFRPRDILKKRHSAANLRDAGNIPGFSSIKKWSNLEKLDGSGLDGYGSKWVVGDSDSEPVIQKRSEDQIIMGQQFTTNSPPESIASSLATTLSSNIETDINLSKENSEIIENEPEEEIVQKTPEVEPPANTFLPIQDGEAADETEWQYRLPSPPTAFRDSSPTLVENLTAYESTEQFKSDSVVTSPKLFEKLKLIKETQSEVSASVISEEEKPIFNKLSLENLEKRKSLVYNRELATSLKYKDDDSVSTQKSESISSKRSSVLSELEEVISNSKSSTLNKNVKSDNFIHSDSNLPNFKITTYDMPKKKINIFEDDSIRSNENSCKFNASENISNLLKNSYVGRSMENLALRKEDGFKKPADFNNKYKAKTLMRANAETTIGRSESFSAANWVPTNPVKRSKSQVAINQYKEEMNGISSDGTLSKSNSLFDVSGLQSLEVMRLIQTKLKTPSNSSDELDRKEPAQPVKEKIFQKFRKPIYQNNINNSTEEFERKEPVKPINEKIAPEVPEAPIPKQHQQPEHRYGPPSINLGTWSERPKSQITLKEDTDYKFNTSNTKFIASTNNHQEESTPKPTVNVRVNGMQQNLSIKVNGTESITPQPSGNVIIKIGGNEKKDDSFTSRFINHTTAIGFRKPLGNVNNTLDKQRPHSVAFDPSFDNSRVPIVRSVELKKHFKDMHINKSITQICPQNDNVIESKSLNYSINTKTNNVSRINSFSQNTQGDYTTNKNVPFAQVKLRRTDSNKNNHVVNNNNNNIFGNVVLRNTSNRFSTGNIVEKPPPPPIMPKTTSSFTPISKPQLNSSTDPRDELLSAIRNFGGKKGLKSIKV